MAGIDTILSQIEKDSSDKCDSIISAAKEEADKLIAEASKEVKSVNEESARKISVLKKNKAMTAQTSSDLKKRQTILKAKQDIINTTLTKAYNTVLNLGDSEYFNYILKILKKNVQAKEGEIYFNEKDLKRLPSNVKANIDIIANEAGGSLKVASDYKDIDGGFVLVYGGIEENCSIGALFRDEKETLVDKVSEVLFKQ